MTPEQRIKMEDELDEILEKGDEFFEVLVRKNQTRTFKASEETITRMKALKDESLDESSMKHVTVKYPKNGDRQEP